MASGEALGIATVRRWYGKVGVSLYNLYGPTEASIDVSYYDTTATDERVPIGRPVANTLLYILDGRGELVPVGVRGEIYIGGVQVARGYLNRAELTAERFVADPFRAGGRLYRTGDLGRWLADGNIEYLGRGDDQVKVRGYRIELGEVEQAMRGLAGMEGVVVVALGAAGGDRMLVGYFTSSTEQRSAEIRAALLEKLPEYMVPGYFVQLERLPLTVNGKVDKKALPSPEEAGLGSGRGYVAPRSEAERVLAEAYEAVLKRAGVSVTDSFFELGGDSIKTIQLAGIIKKRFQRKIEVSELYQYKTIENLAAHLGGNEHKVNDEEDYFRLSQEAEILKQEILSANSASDSIADIYQMSDIQKGMVLISLKKSELAIYLDQFVYQLGYLSFNMDLFTKAFGLLVEKHEILRTCFNLWDYREAVQIVMKKAVLDIQYSDLSGYARDEQEAIITKYLECERKRGFDFSHAPLWRVQVYKCQQGRIIYILQFHHAILDGWSVASLNTELNNLYQALYNGDSSAPSPLKVTNRQAIVSALVEKHNYNKIEFWKKELAESSKLDIFSDRQIVELYSKSYDTYFFKKLKESTGRDGLSIKSMFLGAYCYALNLITYQNEVVVGNVGNVRPLEEDGDKLLGCFLNTIPFRFIFSSDHSPTWKQYMRSVDEKLNILKEYDRSTLFDISTAVEDVPNRENPFFDVLYNYVNFHVYEQLDNSLVTFRESERETSSILAIKSHELSNSYLSFNVKYYRGEP